MKEKVCCEAHARYLLERILPEHSFRGRLLEIGAGSCWASTLIRQQCPSTAVIASDVSRKGLKTAHDLSAEAVVFVACDAEKLPFQDGTFDFVFGNAVIHHLKNVEKGISEIYRVLRNRGKYVGSQELMGSVFFKGVFKGVWRSRLLAKLTGRHTTEEFFLTIKDLQRHFEVCCFSKFEIKQNTSWQYRTYDNHVVFIFRLIISRLPEVIINSFLLTEIDVVATKSTCTRTQSY